jgi:hypothetical protein
MILSIMQISDNLEASKIYSIAHLRLIWRIQPHLLYLFLVLVDPFGFDATLFSFVLLCSICSIMIEIE